VTRISASRSSCCWKAAASRGPSPRGWYRIHRLLVWRLANRLTIRRELQRHPEILNEKLERPIVITGLPRTGTTFLQRLLARDPAHRVLRWGETLHTVPFRLAGSGIDARAAHAEAFLGDLYRLSPAYSAIHRTTIDAPEECIPLLMNSLRSWGFGLYFPVQRYARWLEAQDLTPSYAYYRKQLQILQTQARAERWLLKAPNHLLALDALLSVLPDARIIQTHRDPARVVPSTASLVATWWGMNLRRFSLRGLGRGIMEEQAEFVRRATAIRDGHPASGQFFDVLYPELLADPIAAVRRIYDRFGLFYTAEAERAMHSYLEAHPKNEYGAHRYSLERFGLSRDEIDERFAEYRERFGIGRGRW